MIQFFLVKKIPFDYAQGTAICRSGTLSVVETSLQNEHLN
jgi:hypothetical protein